MASFYVNGQAVSTDKNQKLLRFLRDELRLTSVKDGCSEGACGTCHVLIDGKATKACVPSTDKLEGKHIITVEGLSDTEKEVYAWAFAKAGAVQCGFCIPGMVISAKALLDVNPAPAREEVAFAIRNNICRCTGYKKIIDAILLAAELFRNGGELPLEKDSARVGEAMPRIDAREKVLGTGKYPDDIYLDGMIYGSAVRSKYPRARVLAIHKEKAEALPGVVGVYTADDIPGKVKVGHLMQDWDTMIPVGKITHYLGDAICLVAAETPEILEKAKKLVEVEYEPLKPVFSPTYAAQPFAPLVHESGNLLCEKHVSRGNADQAIRDADYVLMYHYETPYTEHAFLEPECAVAYRDGDGVSILSTDQGTYDTARETSIMLGIPKEKVHVTNMLVGGGFGGKEDMTVQHHAALIAYLSGRPVKVKLSRQESILVHPKRHPMKVTITMGCNNDGLIQGVKAEVTADTGAYASLGGPVLERACTHAAGPYHYENFEITGRAYYTNNPPAGAFRGFGVTQTCYAMEMTLTKMAHELGISPWEIRYRNAIRPGQTLPNGQIAPPSTGLVETLEAVKDICEKNKNVGIACAMKNAGVGVGIPDTGRCIVAVQDGKIHIRSGWLNEQGVKNTRGQKMTYNSVQHLLNNRRYIGEYTYRDVVVPDGIPAIVPQDLFDRVQQKLAKNKKAPARHKAEDEYLLTTKLFCGYCGAYLCGESGTSHTGNVHHYYKCVSVKKKRTECHKKSVRKEWIEDLVVSETMKMVMDDKAIEAIVSMLMDLQDRENVNLPLYEQQLREADTAIQNLLNAIQQGILTKSTKGRLEELEAAKEDLEAKIAREKLAKPKVSAEFMTFWLHRFRKLDVRQKSHRKMLIDTFINAIFLYDDKMVITFNYKEGTTTITFDDLKTALADQKTGSDLDCSTAPQKSL